MILKQNQKKGLPNLSIFKGWKKVFKLTLFDFNFISLIACFLKNINQKQY